VSIFTAAERFAAFDRSTVSLDTSRCLHSQDRYSTCTACFELCPVDAITSCKPPVLNAKKCNNCLACLPACPVGAYEADDVVASLLNAVAHLEEGVLELLCERNTQAALGISKASTGIRVRGCLAGLGSGAYFALAAFRLENILVRTESCSSCEWRTLPKQVAVQVRQAKQLLEAWGKAETLECVSELVSPLERPFWEAASPPVSRRDLFRLAVVQGQAAVARAVEEVGAGAGRRPGRDRLRVLGTVAHLPEPQLGNSISLMERDFAWVSVSKACTACGVCARACPTKALVFEKSKEETTFKLTFSPRNCVGCDICLHVCAQDAVTIDDAPDFAHIFGESQPVVLQEGTLTRCKGCNTLIAFQPAVSLCPLCEYRRSHPFGSSLPPGCKFPKSTVHEEKGS
jgi:ferredoxin